MTSNSQAMSLEEKIVQTLKDDSLMKLVGDEDAITELVKRAIKESLFYEKRSGERDRYGNQTKLPSPALDAALEITKTLCEQEARKIIDEAMETPAIRSAVMAAIPKMMTQAIFAQADFAIREMVFTASTDAQEKIVKAFNDGSLR